MKNTELRIGNILNYTTAEGDILPAIIDWQDLKWISEDPEGFNLVHTEIQLTEEWLLKFGFNKNITIDLYPTFNKGVINVNDGIVYIVNFGFVNHIKYVHQLQNLYLSLTGEELKTS